MYDYRVRPRGSIDPKKDDEPVHVYVNFYLRQEEEGVQLKRNAFNF